MIIDIIVQARMGSKRLPGKVLMPIMGRPMIEYTLESLLRVSGKRRITVAMPGGPSVLARVVNDFAARDGFRAVRSVGGDEDDVASRFIDALVSVPGYLPAPCAGADGFVRICGDSPVIDWRLVDRCIEVFKETKSHLVSNVGGGFPHGQQVEVIDTAFFLANKDKLNREHVTTTLYSLPNCEKHILLTAPPADGGPSLVVDTLSDFERLTKVIELADGRPWDYGWRDLQDMAR